MYAYIDKDTNLIAFDAKSNDITIVKASTIDKSTKAVVDSKDLSIKVDDAIIY